MERKVFILGLLALFMCACTNTPPERTSSGGNNIYLSVTGASSMAKSQDGYYIAANGLVFYYDPAYNEAIPLCNKADCVHGTDSFSDAYYCNAWCDSGNITFWEGSIYYIGRDGVSTGLYKMQADGSGSEKIADLYTYENSYDGVNIGYLNYIYGNGYCYYSHASYDEDGAYGLYLMKLALKKDAKAELLTELPCDDAVADVVGLSVTGAWITCTCMDENENYVSYVIDKNSGEIALDLENVLRACVKEDRIYYLVQGEGIYERIIGDSKEQSLVPETTENLLMGIDDDYIYLDWSRSLAIEDKDSGASYIDIYTYDGKKAARIDTGFIEEPLSRAYMASDSLYIFLGEAKLFYNDIYLLKKDQLREASPDWTSIRLSLWKPAENE